VGGGISNQPTQGPLINSGWVCATMHMKAPPNHCIPKKNMEIKPYFLVKLDTCMKTTKTKRFYNLNKNKTGLVPNPNHEKKKKKKKAVSRKKKKSNKILLQRRNKNITRL
jgi:hypothetical protein